MSNKTILFFIFNLLFIPTIHAQTKINIHGEILGESGDGIADCYIKISTLRGGLVLTYFCTKEKNTFDTECQTNAADSLLVTVSHISYTEAGIVIPVPKKKEQIQLTILLKLKPALLRGITVQPPPSWQHGDTSFFRAGSFAEGSEKKLKDLLGKIPGFELTDDGRLLFKRKEIDKITIDGEELFSDKISLLLNNFPVHLLKTIQVIENSGSNRLLKGLESNSPATLNLGLDKNNVKFLMGDAEAGGGTSAKYLVNPSLFSLLGKVKASFIGNWNNIGNGVGWNQTNEIRNPPERESQSLLMSNLSPQIIPGFENRWYVHNEEWNNRLQVNAPLNPKLKIENEFSFLKDKQIQQSFVVAPHLNGSDIYERSDSNLIKFRPFYIKGRSQIIWSIDSISELKTRVEYLSDISSGNQRSIYGINAGNSPLNNFLSNQCGSLTISSEFIKRLSDIKANQIILRFNHQKQAQTDIGFSADWPAIFDISDNRYQVQHQFSGSELNAAHAEFTRLNKSGKLFNSVSLTYDYVGAVLNNRTVLADSTSTLPNILPPFLNKGGSYFVNKTMIKSSGKIGFAKKSGGLFIDSRFGVSDAVTKEPQKTLEFTTLEYLLGLNFITPGIFPMLSFNIMQDQVLPFQLFQYARPNSAITYSQNSEISTPLRKMDLNAHKSWIWPNNFSTGYLGMVYTRNFTSFASISNTNNFLSITNDSMVKNPSFFLDISTIHEIPSLFFNGLIKIKAGYTKSSFIYAYNARLFATKSTGSYFSLSFRKNWNRKYYIDLNSEFNLSSYSVPFQTPNTANQVLNLKNALSQRLWINKYINIFSQFSFFSNNLFTHRNASFPFLDAECNVKIKRPQLIITIRGENLTNCKYFYSSTSTNNGPYYYAIPLIYRRVFGSVKYNF